MIVFSPSGSVSASVAHGPVIMGGEVEHHREQA